MLSTKCNYSDPPDLSRLAWHNATESDMCNYKYKLTELLDQVCIPSEALYCNWVNCTDHSLE